jgi:hypothetical protein
MITRLIPRSQTEWRAKYENERESLRKTTSELGEVQARLARMSSRSVNVPSRSVLPALELARPDPKILGDGRKIVAAGRQSALLPGQPPVLSLATYHRK